MKEEMKARLDFYEERARQSPNGLVTIPRADLFKIIDQAREPYQPNMFDDPPPPTPDFYAPTNSTPTSQKAAEKATPKVAGHAKTIAETLHSATHGLIRDQICNITGILPQSACGVLNIMENQGFFEARGERVNEHGNDCKIYFITERGIAWLTSLEP